MKIWKKYNNLNLHMGVMDKAGTWLGVTASSPKNINVVIPSSPTLFSSFCETKNTM